MRVSCYRKLLTNIERCASLGITGALRRTTQASLNIILHLISVEDFVAGEAVRNLL